MLACVPMHAHACISVCMCSIMHFCVHACMHVVIHVGTTVWQHACSNWSMLVCLHVCVYECMYTINNLWMCLAFECMHTRMHACLHTWISVASLVQVSKFDTRGKVGARSRPGLVSGESWAKLPCARFGSIARGTRLGVYAESLDPHWSLEEWPPPPISNFLGYLYHRLKRQGDDSFFVHDIGFMVRPFGRHPVPHADPPAPGPRLETFLCHWDSCGARIPHHHEAELSNISLFHEAFFESLDSGADVTLHGADDKRGRPPKSVDEESQDSAPAYCPSTVGSCGTRWREPLTMSKSSESVDLRSSMGATMTGSPEAQLFVIGCMRKFMHICLCACTYAFQLDCITVCMLFVCMHVSPYVFMHSIDDWVIQFYMLWHPYSFRWAATVSCIL